MKRMQIFVDGEPFLKEPLRAELLSTQRMRQVIWYADGKVWCEFPTTTGKRYMEIKRDLRIEVIET